MPRTTKPTKQTAAACYAERHAECQDLLKRIASSLERHKKHQAAEPADWGYAGDLGRVREELAEVLAALNPDGQISEDEARRIVDEIEF
ncbi:MAG: hypothetical protein FJY55_16225 [Betaproteobacteria bacterium]|nr:hypothetical protein [Betaproteobacteria bacterium]